MYLVEKFRSDALLHQVRTMTPTSLSSATAFACATALSETPGFLRQGSQRPIETAASMLPYSSTRSWSRYGMGRWPTGPSTPPSGSPWMATRTCWAVDGCRWRGCEVLDERAHRPAQPRCAGRVLPGL